MQITGLSGTKGLLKRDEKAGRGLPTLCLALVIPEAKLATKRHTVVLPLSPETGGSMLKVLVARKTMILGTCPVPFPSMVPLTNLIGQVMCLPLASEALKQLVM